MNQEVLARCEMMKLNSIYSCMRETETERHTSNQYNTGDSTVTNDLEKLTSEQRPEVARTSAN